MNKTLKCLCGNPAHESTGWILQKDPIVILCGPCAKDFATWYKCRATNPLCIEANAQDRDNKQS